MALIIDLEATGEKPFGVLHDRYPNEVLVPVIWQNPEYDRQMTTYGLGCVAVLQASGLTGQFAYCFVRETRYSAAMDTISAQEAVETIMPGSADRAFAALIEAQGKFEAEWGNYL